MTRMFLCATAIAVLVAAAQAAEPKTVAEIATYDGADRAQIIQAGARKEGSVLLITPGGQIKPITDRFSQKYPFVRLEVVTGETPNLTRRLQEEYKAGRYTVDAMELDEGPLGLLRGDKILQPYYTPERSVYPAGAIEAGKLWTSSYESYKGLGFNTKLVSAAEAPQTYDDLLDLKWKGKMAVAGSSVQTWIGGVLAIKGEDFIRKLGKQDVTVYNIQGRALANLVVSGEVPLSPIVFSSHVHDSAQKGAPIAWRPLDGVYALVAGVALPTHAPHPHAAMLFIDFMLSKEGQTLRMETGYVSARNDLPSPDKPKVVVYGSQIPDLAVKFEQWQQLNQEVFGKPKAAPAEKK
jgi:iron(III) transport system substrate-binding protein